MGARLRGRARDAEIRHERVTTGEHDVLRLDVAMHDALRVRVAKCVGHFECDHDCVLDRKRPLPVETVAQRLALHEGHHIVEQAERGARIEQAEDVWMLELGGETDFALEPLPADGRGELRQQHLDGHLAPVPDVRGQIDGRHAAAPKLALHSVPSLEGRIETRDGIHRRRVVRTGWRRVSRRRYRGSSRLRAPRSDRGHFLRERKSAAATELRVLGKRGAAIGANRVQREFLRVGNCKLAAVKLRVKRSFTAEPPRESYRGSAGWCATIRNSQHSAPHDRSR